MTTSFGNCSDQRFYYYCSGTTDNPTSVPQSQVWLFCYNKLRNINPLWCLLEVQIKLLGLSHGTVLGHAVGKLLFWIWPACCGKEKHLKGKRMCHFELWHRGVSWDTNSLASLKAAGVVLTKAMDVVIRETSYRTRIPAETPETRLTGLLLASLDLWSESFTFTNECHPQIKLPFLVLWEWAGGENEK
jgi:hypothetical protein